MNKAIAFSFTILLSIFICCANVVAANETPNLVDMDNEINRFPWQSYQTLMSIESDIQQGNEVNYLWWLTRKAQSENLLYFYQDFNQTVALAYSLMLDSTPLAIQVRLNIFKGLSEQRQGHYSQSEAYLSKALKQAEQAGLKRLYVFAKQELAYTKTLTEMFETSLEDIQEAYVEAFALKDQLLIATIHETYGAIYGYLNDYEKSIEYYQRAYESYQYLQYPAHIAEAVYGLASTYRYWQKYEQAIKYFTLYQSKIDYTPNSNISFFAAYGLGMSLAEQGSCQPAIDKIDVALQLKGLVDYNAELYKRKASCLIRLGELEKAEIALNNAREAFSHVPEVEGTKWQLEVIDIAAELAFAKQQYQSAYQHLRDFHHARVELLMKNTSEKLLNVRTNLESERQKIADALTKTNAELAMLEQEKLQQQLMQQRYVNVLVSFIVVIVILVIVVQYRANQKMKQLTIKDTLSGVYNRRFIFDHLAKQMLMRTDRSLSVILLDVDNFKQINDKFGHPAGDQVIKVVAQIMTECLQGAGVVSRIGGEEFLCVLNGRNEAQAAAFAKAIQLKISEQLFNELPDTNVTVSIGVASKSAQCQDMMQLYANADCAMYRAKQAGKNQVVCFND